MKPTYDIILDFDDVIFPFCEGVMDVLEHEGIAQGRKITRWGMHEDFGMEQEDFWALLSDPKHEQRLYLRRAIPGAAQQLRRLANYGHRLHIVTARSETFAVRACRAVVHRERLPHDSIAFNGDKAQEAIRRGAHIAVDDAPHNYKDLQGAGVLTYLMDSPHNHTFSVPWSKRVFNLGHFVDTVLELQCDGVQVRGAAA